MNKLRKLSNVTQVYPPQGTMCTILQSTFQKMFDDMMNYVTTFQEIYYY